MVATLRAFFRFFDFFPATQHRLGVCDLIISEYVRMPVHELVAYAGYHLIHIEVSLLGAQSALKNNLKEQIAELFTVIVDVTHVHGVHEFKALLDQIGSQAVDALFPVPGAALRSQQRGHDFDQFGKAIAGALRHAPSIGESVARGLVFLAAKHKLPPKAW